MLPRPWGTYSLVWWRYLGTKKNFNDRPNFLRHE